MQQELTAGQLSKKFIDLQTLRLINNPKRFDVNPFMQEGIIQKLDVFEDLVNMSVQKMCIDPVILSKMKDEVDSVDQENLNGGGKTNWVQRSGAPK